MEFLELAQKRFSCRKFTEEKVEDEKLDKIIKAAILAPTAVNKQPFFIWKIESEEAVEKLKDCTRFHFDARTFLVFGAKQEEAWIRKYDDRNFSDVDASIAATHAMLEVEDLGLGTTWVGHFDAIKLKSYFPEMKEFDLIAIFPIGYPAEEAHPRHGDRKERAALVKSL
ncbi:MAG TPA: nitroreductase family protein [Lachnospiraceae bacterium]